ncbi:oligopeptide transport system substrate-binding protein [Treponema bryantii]|uniref:Oligopeptide transport system substrate-binding protein n=1 Tax=Treponema bryantii TaxID=163 RepID=A0A1I3IDE2_9SPIR|nr:peptide ABC transporter substrate-binding protein [Treponema bryantii]SFI45783.1 oligopeptide transport system substrate-binding protein [Treponema bryantii]
MIKQFKKYCAALLCAACFLNPVFSQEYDPEHNHDYELTPEELLELENAEQNAASQKEKLPQELQQNFIIVESVRVHELNPQITNYSSDSQLLSGLYEGLFTTSPVSLEPQYAIAKEFKISRDKKRWSITLREDARFSNGEKITAEAVRDSWLRMLANPASPYSSLLDIVRGAEAFRTGQGNYDEVGIYATAENVLSIYLNNPANYLPKILCHTAFSVTHSNPEVYSGAYELEIVADRKYILRKNPYYWDKDNVTLERITFVQSDNVDDNTFYYNTGAVDWVTGQVNQSKLLDPSAIQISATFGTGYLYFKMSSRKPADSKCSRVWDYPEFRNAVLEAFPWNSIHKKYLIPATTLVYPLSGYPQIDGFDYTDEIEASLKMKDARAKYGISQEEVIPLVMHVFENEFSEEDEKLLSEAFAPLGVELVIKTVPSYLYYSTVAAADADILVTSWIGDFADPLAFLELFRGASTMNESGWKNEKFDSLLDQAATAGEADRLNLLGQAENILLDEGMVLPLYRSVSSNIVDLKEVGGWYVNAFDLHPLKNLYKKQPKYNSENIVKK